MEERRFRNNAVNWKVFKNRACILFTFLSVRESSSSALPQHAVTVCRIKLLQKHSQHTTNLERHNVRKPQLPPQQMLSVLLTQIKTSKLCLQEIYINFIIYKLRNKTLLYEGVFLTRAISSAKFEETGLSPEVIFVYQHVTNILALKKNKRRMRIMK